MDGIAPSTVQSVELDVEDEQYLLGGSSSDDDDDEEVE